MSATSDAVIPLPKAADLLGIGRSTAYVAVRKGKFPFPVIHIGSRIVVPVAPLLEALGLDKLPPLPEEEQEPVAA